MDNSNTQSCIEAHISLAQAIMNDAFHDSPAEIEEWCKTELCKSLCSFFGIDRQRYKKQCILKSIDYSHRKPLTGINSIEELPDSIKLPCVPPVSEKAKVTERIPLQEETNIGPLFQTAKAI